MKLTFQVIILLLFSTDSASFSRNPYIELLAIAVIILLNFQKILRPNTKLYRLLFILVAYFLCVFFFGTSFNRYFSLQVIFITLAAYGLYRSYGQLFIRRLSQVIVVLTAIVMCFYLLDILFGSLLNNLVKTLDLGGLKSPTVLVYTTHHTQLNAVFPRNAGFTFEPGPFSIFCSFGLILERLTSIKFKLNSTGNLILIAGIITAQSTTGLFLLVVFLFYHFYQKISVAMRFVFYFTFAVFSYFIFTRISILGEKVEREYNQDYEQLITLAESSGSQVALGRFGSLMYEYDRFKRNPIFGNQGIEFSDSKDSNLNLIGSVNAIGLILSRYGILGSLIFLFGLVDLRRIYQLFPIVKTESLLLWWFLIAGFGFSLVLEPFFLVILIYGYLINNKV